MQFFKDNHHINIQTKGKELFSKIMVRATVAACLFLFTLQSHAAASKLEI